jgi:uncharacterized protein YdeI (YjbR/CyaY-like superfamily)
MPMTPASPAIAFATPAALRDWLVENGGTAPELWVHIHKVGSGIASVTWEDCVIAALCVGWIDGIKKSLGPDAYIQRMTPRKRASIWSKRNCDHAERLIANGQMTPAGLAQVDAAKADGRWIAAYAGPAEAEVPADFIAALEGYPTAKATYATLNKQNLYAIYYRLHSARSAETRGKRIAALIATLDKGERFH